MDKDKLREILKEENIPQDASHTSQTSLERGSGNMQNPERTEENR